MRFFVYANLFVSLCAAGLAAATFAWANQSPDPAILVFVFCATLAVYCLDRVIGSNEDQISQTDRLRWIANHQDVLKVVAGFGLIGLAASAFFLPTDRLFGLGIMAVVTGLYSMPILPQHKRLKDVPGLKIFFIAGVWAFATVWLPLGELNWAWLASRAAFICAITIPFDLRDVARDAASGIKTIPHIIGMPASKGLSVLLLVVAFLLGTGRIEVTVVHAVSIAYAAVVVLSTNENRADFFYAVIVEGAMLVYAILMIATA